MLKSIGDGVISVGLVSQNMKDWIENDARGHELQEVMHLEKTSKYPFVPDLIDQALYGENVACLVDDEPVLISRDGSRLMIYSAASPIGNDQEEITGAVLTMLNVRVRKKSEMKLDEACNLLKNL